jgi:hypothetical protein
LPSGRLRLVEALAQRPLSFREFKRLIAAGSDNSDGSSSFTGSAAWGAGSAASSVASADRAGGSERDGLDPETLRLTVAEALGTLPKHLDGLRNGLKGAAAALSMTLRPPSAGGGAAPP